MRRKAIFFTLRIFSAGRMWLWSGSMVFGLMVKENDALAAQLAPQTGYTLFGNDIIDLGCDPLQDLFVWDTAPVVWKLRLRELRERLLLRSVCYPVVKRLLTFGRRPEPAGPRAAAGVAALCSRRDPSFLRPLSRFPDSGLNFGP